MRFGLPADSANYFPLLLLRTQFVRDELRLTGEQVEKVRRLYGTLRAGLRETPRRDLGRETDEAIARFLTAEQNARFRQLFWQFYESTHGTPAVLTNPVAAAALRLTADQKETLARLHAEYRLNWQKGQGLMRPAARARIGEKLRAIEAEALGTLTAQQRKEWAARKGPIFTGELRPGPNGLWLRPPRTADR